MAHFFGTLKGNRGRATRCGAKSSGLMLEAGSWSGGVSVYMFWDEESQQNMVNIRLIKWHGQGVNHQIYEGPVDHSPFPALEALTGADKEE